MNASSAQLAANASITLFRSAKATSTASCENGQSAKTADASIIHLALAYRNRLHPRFQPAAAVLVCHTGIAFPPALIERADLVSIG